MVENYRLARRTRIIEKQNRLEMSQVFSISAHLPSGGFAFQGFYRGGASPAELSLWIAFANFNL
jgi:hypothetical protein